MSYLLISPVRLGWAGLRAVYGGFDVVVDAKAALMDEDGLDEMR